MNCLMMLKNPKPLKKSSLMKNPLNNQITWLLGVNQMNLPLKNR